MSDLVDQINKLEAKAQALKESVSNLEWTIPNPMFPFCRENMLMHSKSSMNWLFIKKNCTVIDQKKLWDQVKKQPLSVTFSPWVSCKKVSIFTN